jgi:hypothetical protein
MKRELWLDVYVGDVRQGCRKFLIILWPVSSFPENRTHLLEVSFSRLQHPVRSGEQSQVLWYHMVDFVKCNILITIRKLHKASCSMLRPTIGEPNVRPEPEVGIEWNGFTDINLIIDETVRCKLIVFASEDDSKRPVSHKRRVCSVGFFIIGEPDENALSRPCV